MSATDFLTAAYRLAMARNEELHTKWISLSFGLGTIVGNAHLIALQRNGRLDLLLRLLERERLDRMGSNATSEPIWALDLQVALSENWLLSAYEVARAAKTPFKASGADASRLLALERRLALVRMPVAKGVIRGMDRKPHKDDPPMLLKVGQGTPELYKGDGSYLPPSGLCRETGAIVWYPVDMTTRKTVAVCRHDLSDEMLALFD